MDKETKKVLENVVRDLEHSNKTNDFSTFILNPNNYRSYLVLLKKWLDKEKEAERKAFFRPHDTLTYKYHKGAKWIDCKGAKADYCDKCGYVKQMETFILTSTIEVEAESLEDLQNIIYDNKDKQRRIDIAEDLLHNAEIG